MRTRAKACGCAEPTKGRFPPSRQASKREERRQETSPERRDWNPEERSVSDSGESGQGRRRRTVCDPATKGI